MGRAFDKIYETWILHAITIKKIRDGPDIRFSILYPAKSGLFQLSGIRPDTGYQKTGYPVFEYPAGYPVNRILMKTFSLTLRFEMLYFLE